MSLDSDHAAVEVVPGLWSILVRLPVVGLRSVVVYAFELPKGIVLVDAGWNNADSLSSLEAGLSTLGASLDDVRGVLLTHAHPDHYGLADTLREHSGSWLALHRADIPLLAFQYHRDGPSAAARAKEWLTQVDAIDSVTGWHTTTEHSRPIRDFVPPDILIEDGERIDLPGWDVVVIHTPGHTPGHVCFHERTSGVVLTGDHVLARITPHVGLWPGGPDDPLGDYLSSLHTIARLGDVVGLPGHYEVLRSVRLRANEIANHHHEKLQQTLTIVRAGGQTVRQVAERLTWSKPWATLGDDERRAALAEAHAHLARLEHSRTLNRVGSTPLRWEPALAAELDPPVHVIER